MLMPTGTTGPFPQPHPIVVSILYSLLSPGFLLSQEVERRATFPPCVGLVLRVSSVFYEETPGVSLCSGHWVERNLALCF